MYMPPQFDAKDRKHALRLLQEHPFASLVSNDDDGLPFVSHLPVVVADPYADKLVLLAHCAKPNPHWRYLQARPRALLTVMGPHAYMSPKVYPDLARVPTWNYVAVHCSVKASLIEEPAAKGRGQNGRRPLASHRRLHGRINTRRMPKLLRALRI